MNHVIEFLSSPIWTGMQGLFAVITFAFTLSKPRKWIEGRTITKWITQVPWIILFLAAGIAGGVSAGIKFHDIHRALWITFATISVGTGIQCFQIYHSTLLKNHILDETIANNKKLTKVIRRIAHLHQAAFADFEINDWKIVHSIDRKGNGFLREELTVQPINDPIYFYFKRYSIHSDLDDESSIKICAENLSDHTPLAILEIDNSDKHRLYAVFLDPPSTSTNPKRIAITCTRKAVWHDLIKYGEDEGTLLSSHQSNFIEIIFEAPIGEIWKGFRPVPNIGDVKIEQFGKIWQIIWRIKNPPTRKYSYKTFIDNRGNRHE